jgi:hypothetical protein
MVWAKEEAQIKAGVYRSIWEAISNGAEEVVWINGNMQNGMRGGDGYGKGDWFYGDKNGYYYPTDKDGNNVLDKNGKEKYVEALMPKVVRKIIAEMDGKIEHIPVRISNAVVPRGPLPADLDFLSDKEVEEWTADKVKSEIKRRENALATNPDANRGAILDEIERLNDMLDMREGRYPLLGFKINDRMRAEAERGFPMFLRSEGGNVDQFVIDEVFSQAVAELRQAGVTDQVALTVSSYLQDQSGKVKGFYNPDSFGGQGALIELAAGTITNPIQTVSHEILHHLYASQLITKP